jgi:hypothetical protein
MDAVAKVRSAVLVATGEQAFGLVDPSRPSEVMLRKRISPDRLPWDQWRFAVFSFSFALPWWIKLAAALSNLSQT